jgi:hypothetical protein
MHAPGRLRFRSGWKMCPVPRRHSCNCLPPCFPVAIHPSLQIRAFKTPLCIVLRLVPGGRACGICVALQPRGEHSVMEFTIVKAAGTMPWRDSNRLVWLGCGKVMLSAHVCTACGGVAAARNSCLDSHVMSRASPGCRVWSYEKSVADCQKKATCSRGNRMWSRFRGMESLQPLPRCSETWRQRQVLVRACPKRAAISQCYLSDDRRLTFA